MPERLVTANAYLGALPVARALDAGADIVITGRCVDSAVTLGVLMHEFGWAADDFDRLAAGSLAGHIIECGCQATGGLHTDWAAVPDWAEHRLPDRRVPRGRQLRRHQAAGDRRARHAGDRRRAAAVRDRRSGQLPAAGRDLRLPPGAHGTGRAASRARDAARAAARRPHTYKVSATAHGRLQGVGAAHHRRHRCARQGQAHRRGAARARPPAAARERVRGLPRHEHRAARHRVRLRAACAARCRRAKSCCA